MEAFDTRRTLRQNSDHLAVDDLELAGKTEIPNLTIERVVEEDVTSPAGKKSKMAVVYFKGAKKGLACNVTNTRRIAQIAGGSYMSSDWIGQTVTLCLEDGKLFGGGRGPTLRVKAQMRGDR